MFDKFENDFDEIALTANYAKDLVQGMTKLKRHKKGVTVFGSARLKPGNEFYELAKDLGRAVAEKGLPVITGGSSGIMEAANKGAFEAGGISIGLNVDLPNEQQINAYVTSSHTFQYFFSRKVCLLNAANAFIYFPGGFGTLDELTEIIVQVQTHKHEPRPIILFGKEYWQPLTNFIKESFIPYKMISKGDEELFKIVDSVEEAITII